MDDRAAGLREVRIAAAGPFDLKVLAALHAACFEDAWDESAIAAMMAMPGAFGLLAVTDAAPAGFLLARVAADEAEILSFGVLPGCRRQGIGGHLLGAAQARAAAEGAHRVFLEVAEDNLPARALYLRCGFAVVGRRPAYYRRAGRPPVAALVMAKPS